MKKQLLFAILFLLTVGLFGQNSSFGLSINSFNKEGENGYAINGNVRVQFNNMFGWQTEVGHFRSSESITLIEEETNVTLNGSNTFTTITEKREVFSIAKTGVSIKFFEKGGFSAETIISGGAYREYRKLFGLLSGEL